MKTFILTEGNKEVEVTIDGESITVELKKGFPAGAKACLLYTSPSPRDRQKSRMPSSA